MIERVELHLSPSQIADDSLIRKLIGQRLGLDPDSQFYFELKRRSIDARKSVQFILQYDVFIDEKPKKTPRIIDQFAQVKPEKTVLIVGAGPAGYFAALELIKLGIRPIVVDRGKDVQSRRKDLRAIQQFGEVNPDSNYCFGEGGAGTYSDGKLYTRSVKRGDVNSVLQLLVEHGAPSDILIDAYPHIGSNRLPEVVKAIRETIERFGGEVHFDSKVTDLLIFEKEINGVLINNQRELHADAVILATGHSARDIFELLQVKKIQIEAKPFALGVRIEHPQELIDEIQYRQKPRNSNLPAAKYAMTCQVDERGVFSFCMCPGGFIVPASTAPGELVINGMSLSRRDSEFANSGIVVAVNLEDLADYEQFGAFKALQFQKEIETATFNSVHSTKQTAPAQRLIDFLNNRQSDSLLKTSYVPGIESVNLNEILPKFISRRLSKGFNQFNRLMRGYITEEAQLLAVESRTSSPIRIPRFKESLMHPQIKNLYPCGEGAGYAGGIISAAMDGQRVAQAIAKNSAW